jgi:DNA-binding transcriptional LysR family regulator
MIERSLKLFRTAAAVCNFTEAAAMCGTTQPNVTKQIANLERRLGVRLFQRTGRSVRLTPAGEILRNECEHLYEVEADIMRKLRNANERKRSYFVGGTATAGSFLLIGMNAVYQKEHPNCAMHLKIERPDALCRMLAAGELALALTDAPYDRAYFLSEPYCMDRLIPVFAPGYMKTNAFSLGDYIRGGGEFILDEPGSGGRAELERFARERGLPEIDPAKITEVCSLDAAKILVQAGGGISVLSDLAVEIEVKAGVLQAGAFREGEILRHVDFIYTADGNQRFIHEFIRFSRKHMGRSLIRVHGK